MIKYEELIIISFLNKMKNKQGFTLIELVVVIGILTVLLTIVLVAINPSRQFKQANDTKRRSDVNAILNAVSQYAAENKGSFPSGITSTAQNISDAGADICGDVVSDFISALPVDPSQATDQTDCAAGYDTHYQIINTGGRITVSAPNAEIGTISVTR
jgi:prepilin-type N-terminal cleavage/methylation domain-containing protein